MKLGMNTKLGIVYVCVPNSLKRMRWFKLKNSRSVLPLKIFNTISYIMLHSHYTRLIKLWNGLCRADLSHSSFVVAKPLVWNILIILSVFVKTKYHIWTFFVHSRLSKLILDFYTVIRTRSIKMLVLDEADEMLNKGFKEQIYDVYRYLPPATQVKIT